MQMDTKVGEASWRKKQTLDSSLKVRRQRVVLRIAKPIVTSGNGKPNREKRAAET